MIEKFVGLPTPLSVSNLLLIYWKTFIFSEKTVLLLSLLEMLEILLVASVGANF